MKVSELLDKLASAPPDAVVLISHDSEGNRYSEVTDVETASELWVRSIFDRGCTELDVTLEPQSEATDRAIILYPVD